MSILGTVVDVVRAEREVLRLVDLRVEIVKHDGCRSRLFRFAEGGSVSPGRCYKARTIARRIIETERLGEFKLWEGYKQNGATRSCKSVSTSRELGWFYADLVARLKPYVIVEFGAAFGVSGMYWLAGIEKARRGKMFSFEVNHEWAAIARANMEAISGAFDLTAGGFEENAERVLGQSMIDVAYIDAIHTSEFVYRQFDIVCKHLRPGGIVILDDIDFSQDMEHCWLDLAARESARWSAVVGGHIGIIELH